MRIITNNKPTNANHNSRNKTRSRFASNFKKRRRCYLTKNRITYVDYKDIEMLKRFLSKSGQILPRFITGTRAIYQRQIALAIKRARFLGLIGFTSLSD